MAEKQHEWYKILRFIIKIHNSIIMLAINFFFEQQQAQCDQNSHEVAFKSF